MMSKVFFLTWPVSEFLVDLLWRFCCSVEMEDMA
jgi:hypothetical protein